MEVDDYLDMISSSPAPKGPRSEGTAPYGGTNGSAKEEGADSKF